MGSFNRFLQEIKIMKLEIDLTKEFVERFKKKHQCQEEDVLKIIIASILEDKESRFYRELSGTKFDMNAWLISKSITELATLRSAALSG